MSFTECLLSESPNGGSVVNMQIKPIKSRFTVNLGTSAAGHKFKVIIIGQSENSWSFKDIKNEILSCYYTADIAWMTKDMFGPDQEVYVLLYNCRAHGLNGNTYDPVPQCMKSYILLDTFYHVAEAWNSISREFIQKCYENVVDHKLFMATQEVLFSRKQSWKCFEDTRNKKKQQFLETNRKTMKELCGVHVQQVAAELNVNEFECDIIQTNVRTKTYVHPFIQCVNDFNSFKIQAERMLSTCNFTDESRYNPLTTGLNKLISDSRSFGRKLEWYMKLMSQPSNESENLHEEDRKVL